MALSTSKIIALQIFLVFLISKVTSLNLKFQQDDYQLKFERQELIRFNKKYVKSYKLTTYKYNRTSPRVNASIEYNLDLGFDVEIIAQAYTFLSNEYRIFPLRMEVNYCEAIAKNYAGSGGYTKCGNFTGCPLVKGKIEYYCNWAPDPKEFPPFLPNGKYMVELQGLYRDVEIHLTRAYATVDRPIPIPIIGK